MTTAAASSIGGSDERVGPPVAGQARDRRGREVDTGDVERAHRARAGEAREEQCRAPDRPYDERLQETTFGIAADDAECEEHREHDAEEERGEHREPDHERPRKGTRVKLREVVRGRDVRDVLEHVVVREPEQEEERNRQQQYDREHLAAQCLAHRVPDDHRHLAHDVSPATASR